MALSLKETTIFFRKHKEFFFFSLITLIGGSILFHLHYLQNRDDIYSRTHQNNSYLFKLVTKEIKTRADAFKVTLNFIEKNPTLKQEFIKAYRQLQKTKSTKFLEIQRILTPYHKKIDQFISTNWANSFEQLQKFQIHLAPHNTILYRINDLSFFGDDVSLYRPMASEVIKHGVLKEGIESTHLNDLYRVIMPIKTLEQTIGALELSFSLSQLMYHFKIHHHAHIRHQISKDKIPLSIKNNIMTDTFSLPIWKNNKLHLNIIFSKDLNKEIHNLQIKTLKLAIFFTVIYIILNLGFAFLLRFYTKGLNNLINAKTADLQKAIKKEQEIKRQLEIKTKEVLINQKYAEIGELASGLSHEIKNPLMIIQSSLTHLTLIHHKIEDKAIQDRIYKTMTISKKNIKRIVNIIDALKIYTKDSKLDEFKKHSFHKLLQAAIDLTHPLVRQKKVKLSYTLLNDFQFECHETQIVQTLVNLINNSCEAVSQLAERWIHLDIQENGSEMVIIFKDSGLGISKDIQDKIFYSFFTTKEVGQGTGLGLSHANNIIRQHNGTITIDNSTKHTTFKIQLPLEQTANNDWPMAA